MKKIKFYLVTACLSLAFIADQPVSAAAKSANTSPAVPGSATTISTKISEADEAKTLLARIDEINAMDKSTLSSAEKKKLRSEVRSIKHRVSELGGGVYISFGALLIIIILLIILL